MDPGDKVIFSSVPDCHTNIQHKLFSDLLPLS